MLPDRFGTERLILRPIEAADAGAIFTGYAQDPEVVRFLTFRPHRDLGSLQIARAQQEIAEMGLKSRAGRLCNDGVPRRKSSSVNCSTAPGRATHRVPLASQVAQLAPSSRPGP